MSNTNNDEPGKIEPEPEKEPEIEIEASPKAEIEAMIKAGTEAGMAAVDPERAEAIRKARFVPDPKFVRMPGTDNCYGRTKQDTFIRITRLALFNKHTMFTKEELGILTRMARSQCFRYSNMITGLAPWLEWMPDNPIEYAENHWHGWLPVYMRNRNVLACPLGASKPGEKGTAHQLFLGETLRIKRDNPMVSSAIHTFDPIRAPSMHEAWFRSVALIYDHISRNRIYMECDARLSEFEILWKTLKEFDSRQVVDYVGMAR